MPKIEQDAWLSDLLRRPVFRVCATGAHVSDDDAIRLRQEVLAHVRGQRTAMYFARVPTVNVRLIGQLARAGFFTVDVNVTLDADPTLPLKGNPNPEVTIQAGGPEHEAVVADIAGDAFEYSRFHLDPAIGRSLANTVKREWARNCLKGNRGLALHIAMLNGIPAGFLAVGAADEAAHRVRVIDLIGVSRAAQRRGVGAALVRFFLERYRPEADVLRVGTQISNVPSLSLYRQYGFGVRDSAYMLHMHANAGE